MKIHVLIENTTSRPDLTAEHGLSLWIETDHHKILFDSGQTNAFAANAQKMGISLQDADLAILSHGHYDHGGGLKKFLELNDYAPVYLNRHAFVPHFNGTEKYIGLDPSLSNCERLIRVDDALILDDTLSLHTCNRMERLIPTDSFGLNALVQDKLVPDDFSHEQYLLIQEHNRKILISGCSHKGILNIVNWFHPDILIGGFHFKKLDPTDPVGKERLAAAAQALLKEPTQYYTGHCTGMKQYEFLKEIMRDRLEYLSTGTTITL